MVFRNRFLTKSVSLQGEKSTALDLARGRLVLISAFFILTYAIVMVRAFDLSIIQGVFSDAPLKSIAQYEQPVDGPRRADIVDRNGILLATTLEMVSLYADPKMIHDKAAAADALVNIFPALSRDDLLKKMNSKRRFVWLNRNIMPHEQREILKIGEPGLLFEEGARRLYPHGNLAVHIVGYADTDDQGLAGLEREHSDALNKGEVIRTTLDVRLQHALRRSVSTAITDFTAKAGTGVVMDVKTGEILAAVSLPDFDPHDAGNAPDSAKFNRLSLGVYELGSMFKIFSTAALLDNHELPMGYRFDAREPIKVGRFTINDYHAEDRELTIPEVFMYSSNIGTAKMGEMIGTEGLKSFYADLGLLEPLDIDYPEVGKPIYPTPWREVNTLTASYGHGIATSPLQLAVATSAIVNDGLYVRPKLVMNDEPQDDAELRLISSKTAHKMQALMRLVVSDGTARKAEVPGYLVGGKTGTAEKAGAGGYHKKKLISSFVGAFPMDDPRYVVMVMVDEPKGNKQSYGYATAGWVAAPAAARVVSSIASILNIDPVENVAAHDVAEALRVFVADKKGAR